MTNYKKVSTPEEFTRWATDAKPGQRVYYFQGWLMYDRMTMNPIKLSGPSALPQYKTCNKAWDFYNLGVVTLVQKKVGVENYLYIAERV